MTAKHERADDLARPQSAFGRRLLKGVDRTVVDVQGVGDVRFIEGACDGSGRHAPILQWAVVGGETGHQPLV